MVGSSVVRTGVDIIGVDRLTRLLTDHPQSMQELFTRREFAYCERKRQRDQHLAGRFAAKEAVLKSFGTGMGQRMRWTDVEIVNEPRGRPRVHLHGEVAAWAEQRGLRDIDVSLSHSAGLAVATAVSLWRRAPRSPTEGEPACAST